MTLGQLAFLNANVHLKDDVGDWEKKICDYSKGLDGTKYEVNFKSYTQIPMYEEIGEIKVSTEDEQKSWNDIGFSEVEYEIINRPMFELVPDTGNLKFEIAY